MKNKSGKILETAVKDMRMDIRKLSEFKAFISGKKVAVLGVGISNRPLIRYIHSLGAMITAFDVLDAEDPVLKKTIDDFEAEGVRLKWCCGKDYLDKLPGQGFEIIFRTPRLRPDIPEIMMAVREGAVLTSEMEVFLSLCPARTFAVTGSDGKTTTTTLISLFLKAAGHDVYVGGNIGTPLLNQIDKIKETDCVVLELSSFQLMTMKTPIDNAVITNISPNHLDFHKNYEEYIRAKTNIFKAQPFWGRLIINADNPITRVFGSKARGQVAYFSWNKQTKLPGDSALLINDHAYVEDGAIWISSRGQEKKMVCTGDILVPGKHNIENFMTAALAVFPFVRPEHVSSVARSFAGVEHRIELVATIKGIRYFNSSIDSSPNRTIHTMEALADRGEHGVLIAGGQDKKCDYSGLGRAIQKVCDRIVLCGDNKDMIRKSVEEECAVDSFRMEEASDYREALRMATEMAKPGEIIILSPAGTSYDFFRHFEERGKRFKELVNELSVET